MTAAPGHRVPRFIGPVVVVLSGMVMLAWSWGTWPDPVIDFGREVYVPWQLAQGKVLYRDIISYFNGPLSPYAHAMLMKLFGVSLRTLVLFNIVLIGLLAGMLWWLVRRVGGELAATAAGVVFFVLFAFGQFLLTGNYNYVTPYSYELPHGITLTVAAIVLLARWIDTGRPGWLAACGAVLGLIALTKAEVLLAAGVALVAGAGANLYVKRGSPDTWLRSAALLIGAAIVPPLLAWGLLALAMPAGEALRGILGAWRWVGQRELTELPYFRELAGTADISASVATILRWTLAYSLLALPGLAAGFFVRTRAQAHAAAAIIFAIVLVAGVALWHRVNWNDFIRPAPLVLLVCAAFLAVPLLRRRKSSLILPLMLTLWAGAMLAKMPLNTHIYHYGFALAMPAMIMLVVIFCGWLPRAIDRLGGRGEPLAATFAAVILVAVWAHLHPLQTFYGSKTEVVATGADQFRADARAVAINAALVELARSARPGDTLVMLPEGLLVNYLARLENPTGQLNFTPPAIIMYGEAAMLERFRSHPPDWIGLSSIDTAEYGPRRFGQDYAQRLHAWIESNYREHRVLESPPAFGRALQIRLLRRVGVVADDQDR